MKHYQQIIVCLYLLSEVLHSKYIGKTSSSQKHMGDENSLIVCKCGKKGRTVKKKLDMDLVADIFRKEAYSSINRTIIPEYSPGILRLLKKCQFCKLSYTKCYGDPNDFDNYICHENKARIEGSRRVLSYSYNGTDFSQTVRFTNKSLTNYPKEIHIPPGGLPHRHRRQLESCGYPTSLQTSELKCKIYPSKVKCFQKCAIGFTLSNGTEVMRICNQDDNVWKPSSFEECRPYIDCSLTLLSGGSKTCSTPTTRNNVNCRVRCEPYEDKPGTGERTYSCGNDGRWRPSLPFCVQAGSGLDLAPKPHRSHKKEKDNYYYYNYNL